MNQPVQQGFDLCERVPEYIRGIAPYVPGKPISEVQRELGLANIVKLASNENPLGASPKALGAVHTHACEVNRYPDGSGFELKRALSEALDVAPGSIVLGNGSNDVLELLARAFLRPGASAVFSQHAFAVYPLVAQACGARCIETPARDYGHDLDAMLAAVQDDTRVIFIANPNNPTGTWLSGDTLRQFLDAVPRDVVVVLDEAYVEYVPLDRRVHSIGWLSEYPNLVVTRTFSKAYGLAGLRLGYALCAPAIADVLNRIRQPFNVNSLAQLAAVAALSDTGFIERSYAANQAGMAQLLAGFQTLKLAAIPSVGNFVAVEVGDAARINQRLLRQGVIVRPVANYGLPSFLRITVGLASENATFLKALKTALEEEA